jgi:hypothetical protein
MLNNEEVLKMKRVHILFSLFVIFIVISCSMDTDADSYRPGVYNMIEVPVPQEGITFPIGTDDDDTASVDSIYYLGETEVTFGLWQAVATWATSRLITLKVRI